MEGPFSETNSQRKGILGPSGRPWRDEHPEPSRNGYNKGPFSNNDPRFADKFAVPHVMTFAGLVNSAFGVYNQRDYDEARRFDRAFAASMRRDCFVMGLMQERTLAVTSLPWHLEVEDENDERQRFVRDHITKAIKYGPHFKEMVYNLLHETIWYGRAAVQLRYAWTIIDNIHTLQVAGWLPTSGDKITHTWDHKPVLNIYAGAGDIPDTHTVWTDINKSMILDGTIRDRFLVHHHHGWDSDLLDGILEAEAVHGSGVRSAIHWWQWMRIEWLSKVSDFFDRFQIVKLWYYELGNAQSEAAVRKAAKEDSDRVNLVLPRSNMNKNSGFEVMATPIAGAEAMGKIAEVIENWMRIYVVGQTLSSDHKGSGGLGGSGAAEFQGQTKEQIASHDAENLAETITGSAFGFGLVSYLQRHTFPATAPGMPDGFPVRFVIGTEGKQGKERVRDIIAVVGTGTPVRANDLYAAAGLTKPNDGDELVPGPQQGMMGAPGEEDPNAPGGAQDKPGGKGGDWRQEQGPRGGKWEVNAKSGTRRHAPPAVSRNSMEGEADQYGKKKDAPGQSDMFGGEGHWITIGGHSGADGAHVGGSPAFIENGRITKGAPALEGKTLDQLDEGDNAKGDAEKRKAQREKLLAARGKKEPEKVEEPPVPETRLEAAPKPSSGESRAELAKRVMADLANRDKAKKEAESAKKRGGKEETFSRAANKTREQQLEQQKRQNESELSDKNAEGALNPVTGKPEPHRLTFTEWYDQLGDEGELGEGGTFENIASHGLKGEHKLEVRRALKSHFPVPQAVLDEYPGLEDEVELERTQQQAKEIVGKEKRGQTGRISRKSIDNAIFKGTLKGLLEKNPALRSVVKQRKNTKGRDEWYLPDDVTDEDLSQFRMEGIPDRYDVVGQGAGSPHAGGHWITMGGHSDPATGARHAGGVRVYISEDGTILKGGPSHLRGRNISNLGKDSREHPAKNLSTQGMVGEDGMPQLLSGEYANPADAPPEAKQAEFERKRDEAFKPYLDAENERERKTAESRKRLQEIADFEETARMPLSSDQLASKNRSEGQKKARQISHQELSEVRKEAEEAGIDWQHVKDLAADVRKHDAEFVRDRVAARTRAMELLAAHGTNAATLKKLQDVGDYNEIPGFDTISRTLGGDWPHLFRSYEQETGEDKDEQDKLWEFLAEEKPKPLSEAAAYRQALEALHDPFAKWKAEREEAFPEDEEPEAETETETEPAQQRDYEDAVPFRMRREPAITRREIEELLERYSLGHQTPATTVVQAAPVATESVKPVRTTYLRDPATGLVTGKIETPVEQERRTEFERDPATSEIVGKIETVEIKS